MAQNVRFKGIQQLDERTIRVNFTKGVECDINIYDAFNKGEHFIDIIEDIEWNVCMSEAYYSKGEAIKIVEALAGYCATRNLISKNAEGNMAYYAKNPYFASWHAGGTSGSCRFSNKKDALIYARHNAQLYKQPNCPTFFFVVRRVKEIYRASISDGGQIRYSIKNGVKA